MHQNMPQLGRLAQKNGDRDHVFDPLDCPDNRSSSARPLRRIRDPHKRLEGRMVSKVVVHIALEALTEVWTYVLMVPISTPTEDCNVMGHLLHEPPVIKGSCEPFQGTQEFTGLESGVTLYNLRYGGSL